MFGSRMEMQRQIGNAVPSLVGEVLAREISISSRQTSCSRRRPAGSPWLVQMTSAPAAIAASLNTARSESRNSVASGTGTTPGTGAAVW